MCQNCGCGCEENTGNSCNCNIIGEFNTEVTRDGNDITVSSPFYEIESDTLEVHKVYDDETNTYTFHLDQECCDDKHVAACESDTTPGVLFEDKLQVDTSGPLTYDLVDCPGDAHVLIGFDVSKLNAPDVKVAVNNGCVGKYLQDALVVHPDDAAYFEFQQNACTMRLRTKPKALFYSNIYTIAKTEFLGLTSNTQGFSVLPSSNQVVETTDNSWVDATTYSGVNTYRVIIGRDAWYTLNMGGSAVVSKGIHTLRSQLYLKRGATSYPLLDDRFEGAWYKDTDDNNVIGLNDLVNIVAENTQENIVADDGIEASLARGIRGHGFGQGRTMYLKEGDVIEFFAKWNTVSRESTDPNLLYQFAYTARGNDDLTNGEGCGVYWTIAELPLNRITN